MANTLVLLAVYLSWIGGHTLIDFGCHIERLHHHAEYHVAHQDRCYCHHDNWQRPHIDSPNSCNHDHSVDVVLYDVAKRVDTVVEPMAFTIARICVADVEVAESPIRQQYHYIRKIPLPSSPDIFGCGLRAPPVVA